MGTVVDCDEGKDGYEMKIMKREDGDAARMNGMHVTAEQSEIDIIEGDGDVAGWNA